MTNKKSFVSNRRKFLKTSGTVVAGSAIAGCAGGGEEGTPADGGDGGAQETTSGGSDTGGMTTATTSGGSGIEGITFRFWDVLNVQSEAARQEITRLVSQFEEETGANVQVNYSGYDELGGAKWMSNFQRGNVPQVFTADHIFMGKFEANNWIRPFDDWKDELGDDILSNIEWILPKLERGNRWMERAGLPTNLYSIPLGLVARNGFQARMDHFEEAGLDPSNDFPPKNFEHLVEVATTLQENGPGQYGFQLFGAPNDYVDWQMPWAYASGGFDGSYYNRDHSATNFDNEHWIKAARWGNELYNEHGVSSPQTPNISDEQVTQLLMQGQVSMSMVEWFNYPEFQQFAPDLINNGDLVYGNMWTEPSGQPGSIGFSNIGLPKIPEGVDTARWERKQEAAVEFLKMFLSKEFQKSLPNTTGLLPVREDVYDEMDLQGNDQHHYLEVHTNLADKMQEGHSSHPTFPAVVLDSIAPNVQQMFRGEKSPEEAMNDGAQQANQVLTEWWDSWEG